MLVPTQLGFTDTVFNQITGYEGGSRAQIRHQGAAVPARFHRFKAVAGFCGAQAGKMQGLPPELLTQGAILPSRLRRIRRFARARIQPPIDVERATTFEVDGALVRIEGTFNPRTLEGHSKTDSLGLCMSFICDAVFFSLFLSLKTLATEPTC